MGNASRTRCCRDEPGKLKNTVPVPVGLSSAARLASVALLPCSEIHPVQCIPELPGAGPSSCMFFHHNPKARCVPGIDSCTSLSAELDPRSPAFPAPSSLDRCEPATETTACPGFIISVLKGIVAPWEVVARNTGTQISRSAYRRVPDPVLLNAAAPWRPSLGSASNPGISSPTCSFAIGGASGRQSCISASSDLAPQETPDYP